MGEKSGALNYFHKIAATNNRKARSSAEDGVIEVEPRSRYTETVDLDSSELSRKQFARRNPNRVNRGDASRRANQPPPGRGGHRPNTSANYSLSDEEGQDFPFVARRPVGQSGGRPETAPSFSYRKQARSSGPSNERRRSEAQHRDARYQDANAVARKSNRTRNPSRKARSTDPDGAPLPYNPDQVRRDRRKRERNTSVLGEPSSTDPLSDKNRAKKRSEPIDLEGEEDADALNTDSRSTRKDKSTVRPTNTSQPRVANGNSRARKDKVLELEQKEAAEELKELDAVDAPYTGPTYVIFKFPPQERGKITVTAEERERLRQRKYLNDSLIDFYLKHLETGLKRLPSSMGFKTKFFSSFFFGILRRTKPIDYTAVKSWTKDVDLFSTNLVFVPICDSYHWSLIIVANLYALEDLLEHLDDKSNSGVAASSPTAPRIIYLDSLDPNRGNDFAEIMRYYLVEEWLCRKQGNGETDSSRKRTILNQFKKAIPTLNANVPVQTNEYDCGLYLMQSLKMFLRNTDGFSTKMLKGDREVGGMYTQVDVQKLRMEIIFLMDLYEQEWSGKGAMEAESDVPAVFGAVVENTVEENRAPESVARTEQDEARRSYRIVEDVEKKAVESQATGNIGMSEEPRGQESDMTWERPHDAENGVSAMEQMTNTFPKEVDLITLEGEETDGRNKRDELRRLQDAGETQDFPICQPDAMEDYEGLTVVQSALQGPEQAYREGRYTEVKTDRQLSNRGNPDGNRDNGDGWRRSSARSSQIGDKSIARDGVTEGEIRTEMHKSSSGSGREQMRRSGTKRKRSILEEVPLRKERNDDSMDTERHSPLLGYGGGNPEDGEGSLENDEGSESIPVIQISDIVDDVERAARQVGRSNRDHAVRNSQLEETDKANPARRRMQSVRTQDLAGNEDAFVAHGVSSQSSLENDRVYEVDVAEVDSPAQEELIDQFSGGGML